MLYGSPGHRPLSQAEYIEWVALLSLVEPAERKQAQEKQKQDQPSRRGPVGRRRR